MPHGERELTTDEIDAGEFSKEVEEGSGFGFYV